MMNPEFSSDRIPSIAVASGLSRMALIDEIEALRLMLQQVKRENQILKEENVCLRNQDQPLRSLRQS